MGIIKVSKLKILFTSNNYLRIENNIYTFNSTLQLKKRKLNTFHTFLLFITILFIFLTINYITQNFVIFTCLTLLYIFIIHIIFIVVAYIYLPKNIIPYLIKQDE